ncbi:MAG: TraR/DksA C4-type zinc finger protein [Pseudomonadota bacterium]
MEDYSVLEAELRERLAELEHRLASIKRDATREYSADSAEQAQERENDEVVDAIGDETRAAISAINTALSKIESDTYGICTNCGMRIPVGRLKAMPEATRCVRCAG